MTIRYDAEYWAAVAPFSGQPQPTFKNVWELRQFTEQLLRVVFRMTPAPETVSEKKFVFKSHDGVKIGLHRFATAEVLAASGRKPGPAVLYMHGGGMVSGTVEIFAPSIARNTHRAGVPFFAVDYRLAPENPAPCGVEDCYAALRYMSEHASELGIDPARIAVMGDSAGGGLAAGVALIARDRGLSPPLAKQILIYPMLDDRTKFSYGADAPLHKFLTWKTADNVLAWDAYLGADRAGRPEAVVSEYAAPARAKNLAGLPPTYIDVGGLDLFRDENVDYAARIMKENIEVEIHVWPGVPHGFESAVSTSAAIRAQMSRTKALKGF
jgi:acetyl esterase/lipase